MIDLAKFGFLKTGSCPDATFYSNGAIDIMEHNENFYLNMHDGKYNSKIKFNTDDDIFNYMQERRRCLPDIISKAKAELALLEVMSSKLSRN